MPENQASNARLQLHDKVLYTAWKGQLYIQDQLVCDIALQSPSSYCIPAQVSAKLHIKEVIRLHDLRKKLPQGIFENTDFTGQEVCCENVYYSFYQVLTSSVSGSWLGKLQIWMQDKDLAVIKFINDQGFLILMPATVFHSSKDLSQSHTSSLCALFLFPRTQSLGKTEREECENKFTKKELSLKVTRLLPGLQYAIREASHSHHENEPYPDALVERYFKRHALPQRKKDTLLEIERHLGDTPPLLNNFPSDKTSDCAQEKCKPTAFAQLKSYFSSPVNFCISLLKAYTLATEKLSNSNDNTVSRAAGVNNALESKLSLAAGTKVEAEIADVPKGKGHLHQSKKKASVEIQSKKGTSKSLQNATLLRSEGREDNSNYKKQKIYVEKSASTTSKTMVKLASVDYSQRRKRGAETLTAEFVQEKQDILMETTASEKRRKNELPSRIMPAQTRKRTGHQDQPSASARPQKRKASQLANENEPSASNTKPESPRKSAEVALSSKKTKPRKLKREPCNSSNDLKDAPEQNTRTSLRSPDSPTANIFEKRINMYESHALNLLADLALNTISLSSILTDQENGVLSEHMLAEKKDNLESEIAGVHKSNPGTTFTTPVPCSPPHLTPPLERELALETKQDQPENCDASQVTGTLLPSVEKHILSNVHDPLAKAQNCNSVTSKICLEHSYSQLPLEETFASPSPVEPNEPSAEIVPSPPRNLHFPSEVVCLTNDNRDLSSVVNKESRTVLQNGDKLLITFNWEAEYNFESDSKFTSDSLEKTINRALHGPWNTYLKEKVEDVKIILHMWLALFYSKSNKQLNSSSRKVVEHSNPAKYVSINTIVDTFDLYKFVEFGAVKVGQTPKAGSLDPNVNVPLSKISKVKKGRSLAHTARKSGAKKQRISLKKELRDVGGVLQQVDSDKSAQECPKMFVSSRKLQQKSTCQTGHLAALNTNAVHDNKESAAEEDINISSLQKAEVVPLKGPNKSKPRISMTKAAFLSDGHETQLERLNCYSSSPKCKNVPDINNLPLPDVDKSKSAGGVLKTTRLSLPVEEDYELDKAVTSAHSSKRKTLVHVEENVKNSESLVSQNEKDQAESGNDNEYPPSTECEAEPLCKVNIDINTDGKHDAQDVSLWNTKNNAAATNRSVCKTSSKMDLENGIDSNYTVSRSSSLSDVVREPLDLSPFASNFSKSDGKAEHGSDINSFDIVSLVTGKISKTKQGESHMTIVTKEDTEEGSGENGNLNLSDNIAANSESETIKMDAPNIHKGASLCESEEPALSVAQKKAKASGQDVIDFNPSGKACDNCAEDSIAPQENQNDFMGQSIVAVQTKSFAEEKQEESAWINEVQKNEKSGISEKDVEPLASTSNEDKPSNSVNDYSMDSVTREEPEISVETSLELPCPEITADLHMLESADNISGLNTSNVEKENVNSMEIMDNGESDQLNKLESKVSPVENVSNDVHCVEDMEREAELAEKVMCHDGLESQGDAALISDNTSKPRTVCYQRNYGNVSNEAVITDNECEVQVYCLNEESKLPDVLPNSGQVDAFCQVKVDVIESGKSDNGICVGSEKSDVNTLTEEPYFDDGLVKDVSSTVDCNLKENISDSHDHRGPLDTSCAEMSRSCGSTATAPSENIILNTVTLDDAHPVYAKHDEHAAIELADKIVEDKHTEVFNLKNSHEELSDVHSDKCYSDITDVSAGCTSPDRDKAIDGNTCEVIILDSSTPEESQSPADASDAPDQNKGTPPTQGLCSESMAQNIIQEHSDICFIASTASISKEQYEHWSETSHKDITFIKHYEDHQEDRNDPGGTISMTPPREPDTLCPSSPTENIMVPHEPTNTKKPKCLGNQRDSQSVWDTDEYSRRYHRRSDYRCSRSYRNVTITHNAKDTDTALHTAHRDTCVSGKSALDSLFFNRGIISDDLTQNTLDMEHLRFIHRLKGVLRNARIENVYNETPCHTIFGSRRTPGYSRPVKKASPLLITIHCSSRRRDKIRHDRGHPSTYYPHTRDEEELVDRPAYYSRTSDTQVRTCRTWSPFHFRRLKYDNGFAKSNSDISGILKECVQSHRLKMSRVSLGNSAMGCTENREPADAFLHSRKTFVPVYQKPPAVTNIIADVCSSLHFKLQSVAKECNRRNLGFYIHETNDDPFFSTTKSLLEEKGYTTVNLQHFCNSKHADSDNLLIVIRNEDISSHIHKIPCLLQLKLLPNVSFAGVDSPEDITDSLYEKLLQDGGFVVSDQSVLETMSLATLKEVAAVLEKLNQTSPWKWLIHFREMRKLKEDKREESVSQMKMRVLKLHKTMNNVEILPYHQCDSRLNGHTENLSCMFNLQGQRIHSRLAVYLTDKHCPIVDELEHNGILVFEVDTFLRRIQKLDAQLQAFW
ncbi:protein TASOR 2 [Spea bombifrons]|uniref:protein TASOR 2 n=1 Tax=Spea bombifrons TaxID=233779 RepID=UPI00234B2BEE|nr:protein TASOR 2 [Spea bombifrons]